MFITWVMILKFRGFYLCAGARLFYIAEYASDPISASRHVSRQGFVQKGLPLEYSFLSSKKGRFFERIYLPFSSVDKDANFAM